MSIGEELTFQLPEGWTLRKVATTMVQEWLAPFRAEQAPKAARWLLQSVVNPEKGAAPLWEAGISTEEYEARLEHPDLSWAIRATPGRGKSTVLASLSMRKDQPGTFQISCPVTAFPERLFDEEKLDQFLKEQGATGAEGLFTALLSNHGFNPAGPWGEG